MTQIGYQLAFACGKPERSRSPQKDIVFLPMQSNLTYSRIWDCLNLAVTCSHYSNSTISVCLHLPVALLRPIPPPSSQPRNSKIIHSTTQLPVAPAGNLATHLFLPFQKRLHWLTPSVKQGASTLDLTQLPPLGTASSHGYSCAIPFSHSQQQSVSGCVCVWPLIHTDEWVGLLLADLNIFKS